MITGIKPRDDSILMFNRIERKQETMLKAISLKEEHLEDAALLVSNRYRQLCQNVPNLPQGYLEVTRLLPLLQKILSTSGSGVGLINGSRLVGFLTGWQMPSFRGQKSTYSPEWANAAYLEDSGHIYEEMYSFLADTWVGDKYVAHYISLFPNDVDALRAWHWMGFGMVSVDALRCVDSIQDSDVNVHIRRADLQDIQQVLELQEALWQYEKGTPIFLLTPKREQNYYEEWLQNPNKVVWLAYWRDEPVALMRLGPADDDVCTIIIDPKTTSIYAAFAKEEIRRKGIATALLDHALKFAQASGYERCAVSFEPMNLLGTSFWLKYFTPVCYSMVRYIDDRVTHA
jgi:GNAT superfamily N-acetyltransferase